MTSEGRAFEQRSLDGKLSALLDYALDEKDLAGDYFHQSRLRRIYLHHKHIKHHRGIEIPLIKCSSFSIPPVTIHTHPRSI